MAPKQLYCRDLRAGDILLELNDGSFSHKIISFGQWLGGQQRSEIIHAAILRGMSYIIESTKHGIGGADLRVQSLNYGFQVYRPRNATLGTAASNVASLLLDAHTTSKNLAYSYTGALASVGGTGNTPRSRTQMDDFADRVFTGVGHPFFCSQFVTLTYQFAAEQIGVAASTVLPLQDTLVSPAVFARHLDNSAHFDHAGYMLPKQR